MTEAVCYLYEHPDKTTRITKMRWPHLLEAGWTETPLYPAEALAAKDVQITELERELENLSRLVQGWHYLAVGPDEMGDYHTQRKLIELSEPYASPALKALKENIDVA